MRKSVLILANEYDPCSYMVKAHLDNTNVPYVLIPEKKFLEAEFKWIIGEEQNSFITYEGIRLNLNEISGVLFRYTGSISNIQYSDDDYIVAEIRAALLGWLNSMSGTVINRPRSETSFGNMLHLQEFHRMLGLVHLKLPKTIITNISIEAVNFHQECDRNTRYTPFLTTSFYEFKGAQINLIEPILEELPVKLEEICPGKSITVYIIGNEILVSGEKKLTFLLPEEQVEFIRNISRLLNTDFIRFDIVWTGSDLVFEKIETYPRYFNQNEETCTKITQKITDHLTEVKV